MQEPSVSRDTTWAEADPRVQQGEAEADPRVQQGEAEGDPRVQQKKQAGVSSVRPIPAVSLF